MNEPQNSGQFKIASSTKTPNPGAVISPPLSDAQIAAGVHRGLVGGLWEQIGKLQLAFLIDQGLKPHHTLLDIGCGALRGGVHFVRYLDVEHYAGLDINPSLLRAGQHELAQLGLGQRRAQLLADNQFGFVRFGRRFDYGIAVSVFTHLDLNRIGRCLLEMSKVMHGGSRFFCTFFQAPSPVHLAPIFHTPGNVTTYYDSDPYHYAFVELSTLAAYSGLTAHFIGEWEHPRNQQMILFTRTG